jgi:hypothetical protein
MKDVRPLSRLLDGITLDLTFDEICVEGDPISKDEAIFLYQNSEYFRNWIQSMQKATSTLMFKAVAAQHPAIVTPEA